MNTVHFRRWLLAPVAMLALLALLVSATPAGADDEDQRNGGDHNEATAINTEDGGTVFDFALSVRRVADGVIDQTNTASAQASCVDCRTVALAFQVVLVSGDADVVVPENQAEAVNADCVECLTYAAATQIVIGTDDMRLTREGRQRLAALRKRMRNVERNADSMTDAELLIASQEAEAELIAIFEEELVPVEEGAEGEPGENGEGDSDDDDTTSTSSPTTTVDRPTSTTTDGATSSTTRQTSTTQTTALSVTTTTAAA